jgi:CheY-like chemotaxis protein
MDAFLGRDQPAAALPRRLELLAVDDDEQDLELLGLALREAGGGVGLETVGDGSAALAYLRGEGPYAGKPRPDLVLLDLNLPRTDGRAFLAERRGSPSLRIIPVVVLTTSEDARDVRDCYSLGANCFVTKPVGFAAYCTVLRAIRRFWSVTASIPARP